MMRPTSANQRQSAGAISCLHYFGAYLPSYARHRVIQRGLNDLGVTVQETLDRSILPLRWHNFVRTMHAIPSDIPVLVGESGNYLSPILLEARRLRRPLVFDVFVSLRDSIEDRHTGPQRKILASLAEIIDRINNWASGAVLLDTQQTRTYFVQRLGLHPEKAYVAYVGAETDLFYPRLRRTASGGKITLLFYGTFIPLHGIDTIIRAAAKVNRCAPHIQFQLVGDGQTWPEMRALAGQLGATNITFGPSYISYTMLPELIAEADICLGIFADRPKTKRVIPNKVYQCAAMGVPVITADTQAIREGFTDKELVLVPPGDDEALATAILRLAQDAHLRASIGNAGLQAVQQRFAPPAIAAQVLAACESLYV